MLIRETSAWSSAVQTSWAYTRRSVRTSSGVFSAKGASCSCEHDAQGSPAGHSSGPPTELSCTVGSPGRGCSRVAVRDSPASSGNTEAASSGRGGVVRVMLSLSRNDNPYPSRAH